MRSSSIPTGTALGFMVLFASALITAPASTVHAQASPNFNCDAPGANLQTKIDSAADGATIFFGGTCDDGPYSISGKDLNLRGFSSGGTLSASGGSSCVLIIEFARVKISRLDIDATGTDHGICVSSGGVAHIFDNTEIRNSNNIGIFLLNGASAAIRESTIKDSNNVGIVLSSGANLFVEHSEIRDNGTQGILVAGSASAELAANEITGNGDVGIQVDVNSTINLNEAFFEDDPDFGVIENNSGGGVRCGISGALIVGAVQNFGTGNAGDNTVLETGCHVTNIPPDPSFPPTSTSFPPP